MECLNIFTFQKCDLNECITEEFYLVLFNSHNKLERAMQTPSHERKVSRASDRNREH